MDVYTPGTSLAHRATSGYPLSIGTSLAFESVFAARQPPYDPSRQIPDQVDVGQYTSCWINIMTLFRNLGSAVEKEVFLNASVPALADTLEEEMEVIQSLFSIEGKDQCKPEFYYSTYKKLKSQTTPGLTFREPSTDHQHFYVSRLTETIELLEKRSDVYHKFSDAIIPQHKERAFALTHYPYDLTAFDKFDKLDLLESNTGVLKPRARWNTKYSKMANQSFAHLPFFRKILLVMGDHVLIRPAALPLRKQLLETSVARNWSPATTLDKVKMDMGLDMRDPYMSAVFNAL